MLVVQMLRSTAYFFEDLKLIRHVPIIKNPPEHNYLTNVPNQRPLQNHEEW